MMFSTPAIWNCCLNPREQPERMQNRCKKMEFKKNPTKRAEQTAGGFDPAFFTGSQTLHSSIAVQWNPFYGSVFGKSNYYFIRKLLILASSFPTFPAHLFINMNHHVFQQEFGWRADIHPFLCLLWNELVFFRNNYWKGKNQCLTFNSWFSSAGNIRTLFQLFLFSNPAHRIQYLNFFITHVH